MNNRIISPFIMDKYEKQRQFGKDYCESLKQQYKADEHIIDFLQMDGQDRVLSANIQEKIRVEFIYIDDIIIVSIRELDSRSIEKIIYLLVNDDHFDELRRYNTEEKELKSATLNLYEYHILHHCCFKKEGYFNISCINQEPDEFVKIIGIEQDKTTGDITIYYE